MLENEMVSGAAFVKPAAPWAAMLRSGMALMVVLGLFASSAQATTPSDQWRLVNPRPVAADLLGATHGNGIFVFVGRGGTIVTSPDGVSWESRESGTSHDLHDVVWTGETFVVVGAGGTVCRSVDGVEWVSEIATTRRLVALAAGPTLVAVGPGGWIFSSPDGIVWTAADSGTETDLTDVVWTGAEFLVTGDQPELLASPDGRSWAARDVGHDGPFTCIASNGLTTVAVAEDLSVWVTEDGVDWIRGQLGQTLIDIVWTGDRFIATGELGYYAPRFSLDGLEWQYGRVTAPGLRLSALASDGAVTVGGGVGGVLALTRDGGQHFKPVNTFSGLDLYGLAVKDEIWVAAAGTPRAWHGALFTSTDGVNWEITYDMGLEALYDVASNDSVFVAVGVINELWSGGAMIRRSSDGRTWHSSSGTSGDGDWPWEWRSVTWDGVRFVAAGTGGAVATSSDASVWHLIGGAEITDHTFFGVASDGETLVAVGGTGVVAVSHDGQTLTVVRPGYEEGDFFDAAWGYGAFVAVGSDGAILTSSDGDQWQEQASGTSADLFGIRFTDESFVAVGDDGVVLTSADGVSWQRGNGAGAVDLHDVIRVGPALIAVGEDGVVVRSAPSDPSLPPVPGFAWRPPQPETGASIRFIDLSDGDPTSWHWDFGDGGSADGAAVTHAFTGSGTWPVRLTVENEHGVATVETGVTVRPFCGAPPATTVSVPASAASGEDFEISWLETLAPGDVGKYIVYEAANPDFVDDDGWVVRDATSFVVSHRWTEAGSFFYRVVGRNDCPDGHYYSEPSTVVKVDIEPDVTDLGEHVRVVTAAASGSGLKNTEWVTDVVAHNPGPYPAPVYLYLLPRVGEGNPVGGVRHWVGPAESLVLADAVADLQRPGAGALLVASDRPLLVGTRTYNDGPNGSFGQFIAGQPVDGISGEGGEARLIQLTRNPDFRTNLALANASTDGAELTVNVFGADGQLLGTTREDLPGLSSAFHTDVLLELGGGDVEDAFAVVSSDPAAIGWTALASVVDNRSGDPVALPAVTGRLGNRVVNRDDLPLIRDHEWLDILFAGDVYVLAGNRGIAWSVDGVHWDRGDGVEGSFYGAEIAWNGSQFLVTGDHRVLVSDDGRSWTEAPNLQGDGFDAVAWDGSRWVGTGSGDIDWSELGISSDGLNWERFRVDGIRLRDIIWVGDRFVAVTAGPSGLATSPDGVSWSVVDGFDGWIRELAWNGRMLIALGAQVIYTSTDLSSFSTHDLGREPSAVVWAGDHWVVSAGPSTDDPMEVFLVGRDGSNWESVPNPGPWLRPAYGMTWDGSAVLTVDFRRRLNWLVSDGTDVAIPAVAHLGGRGGSRWRSDVELHNPGTEPVHCALELVERGESGLAPEFVEITVGASSSVRLPDVIATRFGGRGAGSLTVRPDDSAVIVSSWTYADDPAGSYGQMVPGLRATDAIHGFETGRLIQLRHSPWLNGGFRTNLGFVARCPDEMEVDVRLHRGSGELLGTESVTLAPMGNAQLNNVFGPFTDEVLEDGYAVLTSPTPRCSFYAYASVVDNRTNDPILVPAVPWSAQP